MKFAVFILAAMLTATAQAQTWKPVEIDADGYYYTAVDSSNREQNALGLYASPQDNCRTYAVVFDLFPDNPRFAQHHGETDPVRMQFRIDKHDVWDTDSGVLSYTYIKSSNSSLARLSTDVDDNFLAELITGREVIFRGRLSPQSEWFDTMRYPLMGSAQRINELVQQCSTAMDSEWGDAPEWQREDPDWTT